MGARTARVGLALLLVTAALSGAVGARPADAHVPVRYLDPMFGVTVTKDLAYGAAVNSKGELQQLQLDVYEPTGDTAAARGLVIWAHGSGFRVGDRSSIGPLREYVERGWVGISMGYRLRPELPPNAFIGILTSPDQLAVGAAAAKDAQHDMQAVVRWARAHAADLRIDPAKIAVSGMSAGAIVALMTAFNASDPGDSGNPGYSSSVAAAVSHAGAYVPGLQGAVPGPDAPPVAMYHGTNDQEVPYPTAPPACVLTILAGNTCELVTFAGRDHTVLGADLAREFLYRHVIEASPDFRTRVVANTGDTVTAIAGAERIVGDLGGVAGLVVPTDPTVLVDGTVGLIEYALGAIGLDALTAWG